MPTKSRTIRWRPVTTTTEYWGSTLVPTSFSTTHNGGQALQTVTHGEKIAGYKQRIAQGLSATTSLDGELTRVINPGWFTSEWRANQVGVPVQKQYVYGYLPATLPGTIPDTTSLFVAADNAAKIAVARQIKKTYRAFQGGTFLGELGEAVRMVKSPARSLRGGVGDYLTALKKRQRRLPVNPTHRRETAKKVLADTWLEYSFGWTPLLRDIEDGVKAISRASPRPEQPKLKRVYAEESSSSTSSSTVGAYQNRLHIVNCNMVETVTASVKYYGAVRVENPSSVPFRYWGVSLDDFAPTAWNLLPWSFFADYFANIGDIIECATLLRSMVSWCNKGTLKTVRYKAFPYMHFDSQLRTGWVVGGNAEFERREVSRTQHVSGFVPTLQFRLPGTGRKIANIAALLPQLRNLTPFR